MCLLNGTLQWHTENILTFVTTHGILPWNTDNILIFVTAHGCYYGILTIATASGTLE